MQGFSRWAILGMMLILQAGTVGCKGGGGAFGLLDTSGVFGLFGGSGSSDSTAALELVSLPTDLLLGDTGSEGTSSSGSTDVGSEIASDAGSGLVSAGVIHNPEPGSLALFAGGIGLVLLRRRRRGA